MSRSARAWRPSRMQRKRGTCSRTLARFRRFRHAADAAGPSALDRIAGLRAIRGALLQLLASALDGREEASEVRLQRREDLVRIVLGAEAHLALASASLGH